MDKSKPNEPGTSSLRPQIARQESELLASYYQSSLADQGVNYSPHALDARRPTHKRTLSGDSTSSSDYSASGSTSDHSFEEVQPTAAAATRRASVPSEGGADRRRLAIVQMDTVRESESPPTSSSAVRSRRGFETRLEGLALVAPPDAAGNLHQYINPPSSAPPTRSTHPEDKGHNRSASEVTSRPLTKKSSRDVGIVGTASSSAVPLESPKLKLRLETTSESLLPPVFQEPHSSRGSTPSTRASTPSAAATPPDARSLAPKRRSTDMSVHTPEIGQSKEIHVPVASPVVVDLGSSSLRMGRSSDRRTPAHQVVEPRPASPPLSSYLHYQPGLHATAGPLPPPPRATFSIGSSSPPPPRPPRMHSPPPRNPRRADLDAVNQPLQLAVNAVLSGSSGSSTPSSTSRSISPPRAVDLSSEESADEAHHRREGAFSPSIISTTPSTSPSDYSPTTAQPGRTIDGLIPNVGDGSGGGKSPASAGSSSNKKNNSNAVSPTIPPSTSARMESLREQPNEEWTHISRDLTASPSLSSEGHVSQDHDRVSWESYSPPASVSHSLEATPSAKSRARTSLGAGLKRFASLPRTPSPSSRSRSLGRSSSTSTRTSARSHNGGSPGAQPSPLPPSSWNRNTNFPEDPFDPKPRQPMPKRRKIVSRNPPALSSADISGRKSALERCSLYAQKINELYMIDCGLSEWMVEARFRGSNGPKAAALAERTPGSGTQRNVSHGSVKSEATFPLRPGAMVATDLSTKPSDIAPTSPTLPYPALSPRSLTANLPSSTSTMPMPLRMLASAASSSSHSSGSSKTSGNLSFFSSLGRKASISKPNKPAPMASFSISNNGGGGARLTKAPPMTHAISNPRPVIVSNNTVPSVPGGPRAPPNRGGDRAMRTQSINVASPFSSNMADRDRTSASASMASAKRPSLFAPPSSSSGGSRSSQSPARSAGRSSGTSDRDRDREFEKQVDKLADLLPQAQRDVLAGYLRRAGQDILAIGQYLEDEKNGVVRRD